MSLWKDFGEEFVFDIEDTWLVKSEDQKVWTLSNGETKYFFELETQHLKNIKKLLKKRNEKIPYELLRELHLRELLEKITNKGGENDKI